MPAHVDFTAPALAAVAHLQAPPLWSGVWQCEDRGLPDWLAADVTYPRSSAEGDRGRVEEEGDGPSCFPAPPLLKQQWAIGSSL